MNPRFSVVIPTYNGRAYLEDCLRSLRRQALEGLEVVVVDDASTDGSAEWVRESFTSSKLVTLRSRSGFAVACNAGFEECTGDYIALLNNDTVPDPMWAARMVDFLDAHGAESFAASKVVFHASPDVVDSCGDYYAREGVAGKVGHLGAADGFSAVQEVFGASASAAVYRRELLAELGGFDESFHLIHEDTDLSFRARLLGHRGCFVPSCLVRHHVGATMGYRSRDGVYFASRNQEYMFVKNMPAGLLARYFGLHLMAMGLQFAGQVSTGTMGPWLRGKWDALQRLPDLKEARRRVQRSAKVSPDAIDRVLARGWIRDALRRRAIRRQRPDQ